MKRLILSPGSNSPDVEALKSAGRPMRKVITSKYSSWSINCLKDKGTKDRKTKSNRNQNQDKPQVMHKATSLPRSQTAFYSRVANRYRKETSQPTEPTIFYLDRETLLTPQTRAFPTQQEIAQRSSQFQKVRAETKNPSRDEVSKHVEKESREPRKARMSTSEQRHKRDESEQIYKQAS